MKRICIFCGSNKGNDPVYAEQATLLGQTLAKANIGLVYGGTTAGLMGIVADAALAAGGEVIGIIPERLAEKSAMTHQGLSQLLVVESMHARKAKMAELSDGFIALPGGIGTFEELFEMLTWSQLGFHHKPTGVLNIKGFYDPLIQFLDSVIAAQFMKPEHRQLLINEAAPLKLLEKMRHYQAPTVNKWFDRPAT